MGEEGFFIHEYHGTTTLHPIALIAIIVLGVLILLLDYRRLICPILLMAGFISSAQRIVIADLDFTLFRIFIIIGWIRILSESHALPFPRFTALDRIVIFWALARLLAYYLTNPHNMMFIFGRLFDAVMGYFLFRYALRSKNDIRRVIRILAVMVIPISIFFLVEKTTGLNIFSIFGGVPLITVVRENSIRCTGAFPHSIIAGCFWASSAILILSDMPAKTEPRSPVLYIISLCCAFFIIWATASSTPIITLFGGLVCFFAYRYRRFIPELLRYAVLGLIALELYMEKHVWHLIGRIDIAGGSTGYHRYRIIEAFVNHFEDWFFSGIVNTAYWGAGLADVTNQYVYEGISGGLLSLIAFILILKEAFKSLVLAHRNLRENRDRRIVWGIGISVLTHMISFISVSYFGQIYILWYLTLAMAGSLREAEGLDMPAYVPMPDPSIVLNED